MSQTQSDFRMMHTMIRVLDLKKSIEFYTELLGMKLLRKQDFPEGKFALAFVGYGPEASNTVVELTHNWDQKTPYEIGAGFGHLALGVNDIYAVCAALEKRGAKIPRKPGADEARNDSYRLRRGPRRLQDRAHRPGHDALTNRGPAAGSFRPGGDPSPGAA